jgi:hypothetical protein
MRLLGGQTQPRIHPDKFLGEKAFFFFFLAHWPRQNKCSAEQAGYWKLENIASFAERGA